MARKSLISKRRKKQSYTFSGQIQEISTNPRSLIFFLLSSRGHIPVYFKAKKTDKKEYLLLLQFPARIKPINFHLCQVFISEFFRFPERICSSYQNNKNTVNSSMFLIGLAKIGNVVMTMKEKMLKSENRQVNERKGWKGKLKAKRAKKEQTFREVKFH